MRKIVELNSKLPKKVVYLWLLSVILQFVLSIIVCVLSSVQLIDIQEKHAAASYSTLIYNHQLIVAYLIIATLVTSFYLCKIIFSISCIEELTCTFFIALIIIIIEAVCEALFFSHTVCFKDNDQTYTIVRSIFAIMVMLINIGINDFLYSKHKPPGKSKCLVTYISLINVLSIALIVLNVILLVNIKKYSLPIQISSKDIKLGFFNSTVIAQIDSGVYVKDELYKYRVIATLDQVLNSHETMLAYTSHGEEIDTDYYYIVFTTDLYCNSESIKFYKDCQNNIALKMIFRYINDTSIPKYNCASVQNNQSVLDCPNLTNSYSLVLIQEEQDTVSFAWKSIANCNQIRTFYVDRNPILDPTNPFRQPIFFST